MKQRVKKSIVCKNIGDYSLNAELIGKHTPRAGDVALYKVLEIGKHKTIQSDSGRNCAILEDDLILAAFGARYATSQFEGYVPTKPVKHVDILGAGGVVGELASKNAAFEDIEPTRLEMLGYACHPETGAVLNTIGFGETIEPFTGQIAPGLKIVLSLGSSMDSGKTTSAAFLVKGLKDAGARVGFIKLTGTCYTKDKDFVFDLGADVTLDFGDLGYPSTFLTDESEILAIYQTLVNRIAAHGVDFIVMEIADGLLQRETNMLINNKAFRNTISNTFFSCGDSLSAMRGIEILNQTGLPPFAVGGLFTMSPLLIQEVKANVSIPVFDLDGLRSKDPARLLGFKA